MQVAVVSVFPEMFDAVSRFGITARAVERSLLNLTRVNPRDFTRDRHRSVDDRPYGGGPGMVMRVAPLRDAIRDARDQLGPGTHAVCLTPQGRRLDQDGIRALLRRRRLVLVCGRYEGIDERLIEAEIDEEVSIGDYVLSGGELAAMVLLDAMTRLIPGALGDDASADEDSFAMGAIGTDGLGGRLDCPHYTRPEEIDGRCVPAVLLSGDHAKIRRWRLKQSLGRTWLRRPDLLNESSLTQEQRALLDEFIVDSRSARCGARH